MEETLYPASKSLPVLSAPAHTKTCARCGGEFGLRAEDLAFYEKIKVPPPTWCPDCRARRRMLFWNQVNLFRKKEAKEGKEIFSTYPESSHIRIYDRDFWWTDAWDPMEYAKDVDFSRPFLAQVKELMETVPYPSRSVRNTVRSEYCDGANDFKDCYLCFDGDHGEECMYGLNFYMMRHSMDFYATNNCDLCYELFAVGNSFRTRFAWESVNCRDSWFLADCSDMSDSVGCVNMGSKRYYILNRPYTKEDYEKKLAELDLGSYKKLQEFKRKFEEFRLKFPVKYAHVSRVVNVLGEYVYASKNAYYCYDAVEAENVAYVQRVSETVKDSYDYTDWGDHVELMYESAVCGDKCRGLKFCFDCWPGCQDMEYSIGCHSSSNLFGCVGLNKKQYCILNRQYSKEEYEALAARIRQHMLDMPYRDSAGRTYAYGEFFPEEFSPLAYNESSAQEFYALTEEEAKAKGYVWRPIDEREFQTTLDSKDLPDHIKDATDDIVKAVIRCDGCSRAFRILPSELEFYRHLGTPLPRLCHRCRIKERLSVRNVMKFNSRTCQCTGRGSTNGIYKNLVSHRHGDAPCTAEFQSAYAPDRPEIVYCEACYQSEVA